MGKYQLISRSSILLAFMLFTLKPLAAFSDLYGLSQDEQNLVQTHKNFQSFKSADDTCHSKADTASFACNPTKSSDIQQAGDVIGALIDAGGSLSAMSMNTACSTLGKVLQAAAAGTGAFRAQCSTLKMLCESSCSDASAQWKAILSDARNCAAATGNSVAEACKNFTPTPDTSKVSGSKFSSPVAATTAGVDLQSLLDSGKQLSDLNPPTLLAGCQGYAQTLAKAGVNLGQFIGGGINASQCDSSTSASAAKVCKDQPTLSICANLTVDCTNSANASNTTCICQKNPYDPVCGNLTADNSKVQTSTASGSSSSASNDPQNNIAAEMAAMNTQFGDVPVFDATKSSPTSTNRVQAGGGPGLSGGSAGSGGAPAGKASGGSSGSAYDTNILGGVSGGGGGRFGIASSNSGQGLASGTNFNRRPSGFNYKQFLPGGPKAGPGYKMSGQEVVPGVTGPAGKSNWDKISDRYRDNRQTLEPE